MYAPTLFVEYGGHTFAVSVQGGVPVGSYYVGGFTIDYKNDIAPRFITVMSMSLPRVQRSFSRGKNSGSTP